MDGRTVMYPEMGFPYGTLMTLPDAMTPGERDLQLLP